MKIYSMTATFGKLEHDTLTLRPGLNVIDAPNEWGKSTWCAFLVNMLYGIDTRAKTTKTTLADKERYAPWSGSPMAGRIDLNWNGRDITIERTTRGRLIFGDFKAYETETGITIPELTALNCGQTLLGVERSVFERSGFIRLADLPVTQDDALRRRLNNLVTTGDESGAGDKLGKQLKDLKNKCRFNRTGLLPQAETQRSQLEGQLHELKVLDEQSRKLVSRQAELEGWIKDLSNHQDALNYEKSKADTQRLADALEEKRIAQTAFDNISDTCSGLPSPEEARMALQKARGLLQQQSDLQLEERMLPTPPEKPQTPERYRDLAPEEAVSQANDAARQYASLNSGIRRPGILLWILGALLAIAGGVMYFLALPYRYAVLGASAAVLVLSLILTLARISKNKKLQAEMDALCTRWGSDPKLWLREAENNLRTQQQYNDALSRYNALRGDLDGRKAALEAEIRHFTDGEALDSLQERWAQTLGHWDAYGDARRDLQSADSLVSAIQAMSKPVQPPAYPDTLTHTAGETDALLSSARFELRQLQLKLGQNQGRSEALGQKEVLESHLRSVNRRIHKLEDTYAALELAQNSLYAATTELQRRFAPRISKRAQALFGKMTGNRYQRLTLGEDLSLQAGAEDEDTLHSSLWRSDGTVDQLYFALRLAVSEELTPDAPLVLDDAFVRFDDTRLAAAMDILKEAGEHKQVILFTCQDRERKYL